MNTAITTKESIYDDNMLEFNKELEPYGLIEALMSYTKDLEAMVLQLRKEVNDLTPPGKYKPYEDIHSDIYEVFDDYPAYQKFKDCTKLNNLF